MELLEIVQAALQEDVGSGDATTLATVDGGALGEQIGPEGVWQEAGTEVLRLECSARALLTGERVALNLLQHLSGIATLTARYVKAVEGTGVQILDTRKTTPGLRTLEKAAVRAGGGVNHRAGLFDAILIKENHIALSGGLAKAVLAARNAYPDLTVEVECRNLDEVSYALGTGADILLLDNMDPETLREAVRLRDENAAERAPSLEASGGIRLDNVRSVAETGVDWISVGALTHSAPAMNLALDFE